MQWQASYILYSVHREKKCKTIEFAATLRRNERVRFMLKAVMNDLNCILFCQTNVSIPMKRIPEILFPPESRTTVLLNFREIYLLILQLRRVGYSNVYI